MLLACNIKEGPLSGAWLYAVMDGHAGKACVEFIQRHLVSQLISRSHSIEKVPLEQMHTEALTNHAEGLQAALCDTFVSLHNLFCETGDLSGATLTVCILSCSHRLLTICNVGDTEALIDTGASILEATSSHRTHDMVSEQERLRKAGYIVAALGLYMAGPAKEGEPSVGPLRIWPGGLCPSRTIGDVDAGPGVVPVPHIKQILIPDQGCRLILASDGLWDNCSHSKVVSACRNLSTNEAAQHLCAIGTSKNARVKDDCSVIVVDILNPKLLSLGGKKSKTFPQVCAGFLEGVRVLKPARSGGLGSIFLSYLKSAIAPSASHSDDIPYSHTIKSGPGHLLPWFDVDCLDAYYPTDVIESLVRNWVAIIVAKREKSHAKELLFGEIVDGLPLEQSRSLARSSSTSGLTSSMTPDELGLTKEEEDQMNSPNKMATIRLKSVSHYRSGVRAIDRDDLTSKFKEGTKSALERASIEFEHMDVEFEGPEDNSNDEDESYDFSMEAEKGAAAAAVEAALTRAKARAAESASKGEASDPFFPESSPNTAKMPAPILSVMASRNARPSSISGSSSEAMANLARNLMSQRHLTSLQILNKVISKGKLGGMFIISSSDGRSTVSFERDSSAGGGEPAGLGLGSGSGHDDDGRGTLCKAPSLVKAPSFPSSFHQTVPSWLLPSEALPERERLCPDLLLVDQLPRMVAQWDTDSIPTLLTNHPLYHKVVIMEVSHCTCGSGPSPDLFVDNEAGSRKKAHSTLHAKVSSAGLTVSRFQLDIGCEMCGETNQNLTKLLRDKMGVDALRASECTQRLHRHATQCSHRLLHHFQTWRALVDPTSRE